MLYKQRNNITSTRLLSPSETRCLEKTAAKWPVCGTADVSVKQKFRPRKDASQPEDTSFGTRQALRF